MGFLQDADGNFSSKRLAGFVLLIIGALIVAFMCVYSIFKVPADARTVMEGSKWLVGIGAGLLGIGLFEKRK